MSNEFNLNAYFEQYQKRIKSVIEAQLDARDIASVRLLKAMQYATLNGGKRIRPILAYASAEALRAQGAGADIAACAVELIHCYSLVHDDLPAMDDDDLRRGQPTLHRAFDEATAVLAGDALQSLAFQLISEATVLPGDAARRLLMISILARASGAEGMVGGQTVDFEAVGLELDLEELQLMHRLKTGALISASVQLGALSAGVEVEDEALLNLKRYGECIGLAFQVQDDIIDVTSDTETLGKTQGADQKLNKPTYTALLGLEGARQHAIELTSRAISALAGFGTEAEALRQIARYIVERRY